MDKKPLIIVSIGSVVLLVVASLGNAVGYQSETSILEQTNSDGPDIKFTHKFSIKYGAFNDIAPYRCLIVEFSNQGDEDIEFWDCHGSGTLLFPLYRPSRPLVGGGSTRLAPAHYIHPGDTASFGCLYLDWWVFWPQIAKVLITIQTGKDGWYPITDKNYINGIFLFWNSKAIPLFVQYID